MAQIETLEQYLDIILAPDSSFPSEHELLGDGERFEFYDQLKVKMGQFINGLRNIDMHCEYFTEISVMSNEDIDYCLRQIAIEAVIAGQNSPVIDDFAAMLKQDSKVSQDELNQLKQESDDEQRIIELIQLYEAISADFEQAKQGIIAKDKKMMEILRTLKIGVKGQMVDMAIKKMPQKSQAIKNIISKNSDKDSKQKGV